MSGEKLPGNSKGVFPYMVILPGNADAHLATTPWPPEGDEEKYLVVNSDEFYQFMEVESDTPPTIVHAYDTFADAAAQRDNLNQKAGTVVHPLREQMEMEFSTLGVSSEFGVWTIPPEDRKGLHVGVVKQLNDGTWCAVNEATDTVTSGISLQDAAYHLFAERMRTDSAYCTKAQEMYPHILFDNYI